MCYAGLLAFFWIPGYRVAFGNYTRQRLTSAFNLAKLDSHQNAASSKLITMTITIHTSESPGLSYQQRIGSQSFPTHEIQKGLREFIRSAKWRVCWFDLFVYLNNSRLKKLFVMNQKWFEARTAEVGLICFRLFLSGCWWHGLVQFLSTMSPIEVSTMRQGPYSQAPNFDRTVALPTSLSAHWKIHENDIHLIDVYFRLM